MKKVSVLLSVIGVIFLMTSCLPEGSNSYTDSSFVYVAKDDAGVSYGKTFPSVRLITNSAMTAMEAGSFKVMSYRWDEKNGATSLLIGGKAYQADNVQLLSSAADVAKTSLIMTEPTEQGAGFYRIAVPIYSRYSDFMGDHWVFEYAYQVKKNQKASVTFHKRNAKNESGETVIDVRLTLTGTPEGDSSEMKVDAVAVNMSQLRAMSTGEEDLKIRFYYYKKDSDEATSTETESQVYTWKIGADE